MKTLYTAEVTAQGGREGSIKSNDGTLVMNIAPPKEMGGAGKEGTNPEQLFAAAWGPCFLGALGSVAKSEDVKLGNPKIEVQVSFNEESETSYIISAKIHVIDESVDNQVLTELVNKTQQVCPYSKATRGNIDVELSANQMEIAV